ncbi:MAG: amidase domain-containing protein [Clostridia bacterium]|nr:amidase domain-containing protein [Clostridia bacterium]
MLLEVPYNRENAVVYAKRWALSRNPLFLDFTGQGGNCTNFVSQCILAGCGVTNDTPTFGWYYRTAEDRAPAWTGVDELYSFLTGAPEFVSANGGAGPYGEVATTPAQIALADVIQLANDQGEFYHSLIISGFTDSDILVCAQSDDALDRPLSTYQYASLRILHLLGARLFFPYEEHFEQLLRGTMIPS